MINLLRKYSRQQGETLPCCFYLLIADTIFESNSVLLFEIRTCLKNFAIISAYCLLLAWPLLSWSPPPTTASSLTTKEPAPVTHSLETEISSLYDMMNLEQWGLSKRAFSYAYKGYITLVKKKIISRQQYLTICDFGQSSKNKRLYVLDMACNEVVVNTYVAHGRMSGGEYATRFSNRPRSNQSSLGFYKTMHTYHGEHGLSLRVKGLEAGYNDKAGPRAIVIHGADYIGDKWLERNSFMGRSYGCPAVPREESRDIINTIKDGSCLFIYYPSKSYLTGSKILNG